MTWLPTLIASTPEEGFEVAVKLTRVSLKEARSTEGPPAKLNETDRSDASYRVAMSHVIALNFHTVAAANQYWSKP